MLKFSKNQDELSIALYEEVIFLSGAFLIGAVLGSFFVSGFTQTDWLEGWLVRILSLNKFFLLHGCLTLVLFGCLFLPGKRLIVPFTVAVEGFLLSCLITSYIHVYGYKGYGAALIAWLIPGIVTVVVQFLLGCQMEVWSESGRPKRRQKGFGRKQCIQKYAVCGLTAFAALLLVAWLQSRFLSGWTAALLQRLK